MLTCDYGIDKVEIYDWYYPNYNADNDDEAKMINSKKRLTLQMKFY